MLKYISFGVSKNGKIHQSLIGATNRNRKEEKEGNVPSVCENDISVTDLLAGRLRDRFRGQLDVATEEVDRIAENFFCLRVRNSTLQRRDLSG